MYIYRVEHRVRDDHGTLIKVKQKSSKDLDCACLNERNEIKRGLTHTLTHPTPPTHFIYIYTYTHTYTHTHSHTHMHTHAHTHAHTRQLVGARWSGA